MHNVAASPPHPPTLHLYLCECAVHSVMCVCVCRGESGRGGAGGTRSPGCSSWRYSSLSPLPLSDNSAVIQAGVDGQSRARDEAPWPLEIHFHPAFISFPFSAGPQPTLTPVHTERLITQLWSILIDSSLSTNYSPKKYTKYGKQLQANTRELLFSGHINVDGSRTME